ncbi:BACON domain-containing protein [Roseimarinus sediminis]|uniref:BACON domain-containing protein n=1 Tax=Roseimarinus sediminis TaxID=1610899 RepID=UPI003D21D2AE
MQKNHLLLIAIVLIINYACSDNFLNDTPQITQTGEDTIFIEQPDVSKSVTLRLNSSDNIPYAVFQYPYFMRPSSMTGDFKEGSTIFTFWSSYDINDWRNQGGIEGQLVLLLENNEAISYTVKVPERNELPEDYAVAFNPSSLHFGTTSERSVAMNNNGSHQISWNIESLPDWLSTAAYSGTIAAHSSYDMYFVVNRIEKPNGSYYGYVRIALDGNPANIVEFEVSMEVNEQAQHTTELIEGHVVAARYLKQSDRLLLLSQSPNRLSIINLNDEQQQHIELPRKPAGMNVSEDESQVILAYTVAEVAIVDLGESKISQTYELPFIPFGTAIGENGWYYISSDNYEYNNNLLALNGNNGNIIPAQPDDNTIREKSSLYKVPGRKLLLGIPSNLSPSTTVLINYQNDTITSQDADTKRHDSGGKMWLIKNGTQALTASKNIFKFDFSASDFVIRYGTIEESFSAIHWADECTTTNQALLTISDGYQHPAGDSYAALLDLESYGVVKNIDPGNMNNKELYVYFAFLSAEGNQAFLITRDEMNPYTTDGQWYLQRFELNQ